MVANIKICGIPHKVKEYEDVFSADAVHFGEISFKDCEIKINKDMTDELKEETLYHEILHGILVHLGYNEFNEDEQFVQALSNAIYQTFKVREVE